MNAEVEATWPLASLPRRGMRWGSMLSRQPLSNFLRTVGFSSLVLRGLDSEPNPQCMRRGRPAAQDVDDTNFTTTFSLIPGNPDAKVEDSLCTSQDSNFVKSTPFISWVMDNGPPATASAPRSKVVSTILHGTRRPTSEGLANLADYPFVTNEVTKEQVSAWVSELDLTPAFATVYPRSVDWVRKANTFTAQAPHPDNLLISEDSYEEIVAWDDDEGPQELEFLHRLSIADLINADARLSDAVFQPACLSRATLIMGSKDCQADRDEESSTVRLAAELITGILTKDLRSTAPSASSLASRFALMMRDVKLIPTFCMHDDFSAATSLREFELGYNYAHASASEARAIEDELFLNVGDTFPAFKPLLEKFPTGPEASAEFNRLAVQLLPANLITSSSIVKLPALSELLSGASWRSAITHFLNTHVDCTGPELVNSLIRTHTEVAQASVGGGGGAPAPLLVQGGASADLASFGTIREQSIGDALRSPVAACALDIASNQTGIDRVETIMQSNSVLLTRAELMQEAWLHNKNATLAFCSLDQPYLCPYFASVLTEDPARGKTSTRLASYNFPSSELATLRTKDWSKLDLIGEALKIRKLQFGTAYASVKAHDLYTVESCLRIIREHGSRLFFACNLSLSPVEGYSFTDGVDLHIEGLQFAQSLPRQECAEWYTFLTFQFKHNWLDAGGLHYHSKLRSGRPDSEEAQLSEFLPSGNSYFSNIKARMTRAEPIAEFRMAFPSMFSADAIALPGTSAGSSSTRPGKGGGGGAGTSTKPGKGKGKQADGKRLLDPDASGPGSKSALAMPLSPTELWYAGAVFQTDKIASHFKIAKPEDFCWPVLLSKKKGDAALEVCPDHAGHGDLKQACHKRPSNFNLDHIYKNFTRGATAAENKKAGWSKPPKKSKN